MANRRRNRAPATLASWLADDAVCHDDASEREGASIVHKLLILTAGFTLGFAIVSSSVAALALAAIGVGGHLLARNDRDYARVISFDPSTVASQAPYPAIAAVAMAVAFILVARRLQAS